MQSDPSRKIASNPGVQDGLGSGSTGGNLARLPAPRTVLRKPSPNRLLGGCRKR